MGTLLVACILCLGGAGHPPELSSILDVCHSFAVETNTADLTANRVAPFLRSVGPPRDFVQRGPAGQPIAPPARPGIGWEDLTHYLRWFPSDCTLVGALDFSVPWVSRPFDSKEWQGFLSFISPDFQDRASRLTEDVGTILVDRVAFALFASDQPDTRPSFLLRLVGRWDGERLARYLSSEPILSRIEGEIDGVSVVTFGFQGSSCVLALIGAGDLVLVDHGNLPASLRSLKQMNRVRQGLAPNVLSGPFAEDLRTIGPQACGFVVGQIPETARQAWAGQGSTFPPLPRSLVLRLRAMEGIRVDYRGLMADPAAARAFVEEISRYQAEQSQELRHRPDSEADKILLQSIETIRWQTDGAWVRGQAQLSPDLPWALGQVLQAAIGQALGALLAGAFQALAALFKALAIGLVVLLMIVSALIAAVVVIIRFRRARRLV